MWSVNNIAIKDMAETQNGEFSVKKTKSIVFPVRALL